MPPRGIDRNPLTNTKSVISLCLNLNETDFVALLYSAVTKGRFAPIIEAWLKLLELLPLQVKLQCTVVIFGIVTSVFFSRLVAV